MALIKLYEEIEEPINLSILKFLKFLEQRFSCHFKTYRNVFGLCWSSHLFEHNIVHHSICPKLFLVLDNFKLYCLYWAKQIE